MIYCAIIAFFLCFVFIFYISRHSWATIAQNNCGASTAEVGFALNHSSAHRVTEGYIKKDYSPISVLNEKVIACVFGGEDLK